MSRRGPVTGALRSSTCPRLAGSSPARILSKVDLPQPDGPTRATNSPSRTSKSISSRARTVPRGVAYSLRSPLTAITGSDGSGIALLVRDLWRSRSGKDRDAEMIQGQAVLDFSTPDPCLTRAGGFTSALVAVPPGPAVAPPLAFPVPASGRDRAWRAAPASATG